MNTNYILIGCGAFAAGICIGFFAGKKSERSLADKQIRELRDYYNRKTKCIENEEKKEDIYKKTISEYAGKEEKKESESSAPQFSKLVNDILENREKVEKILAESESPEEDYDEVMTEEEIDKEEWQSKSIWAADKKDPYVITYNESEEHPEIDKITLLYYVGDGTLTTEDEELIEDVKGTVGNCLDDFEYSDDRNLYVRNKRLGTDFEIIKVESSFY